MAKNNNKRVKETLQKNKQDRARVEVRREVALALVQKCGLNERFELLAMATLSWKYSAPLHDESTAATLLEEIGVKVGVEKSASATLIDLPRFPVAWYDEMQAIVLGNLTLAPLPPRGESILSMSLDDGKEFAEWACSMLKVSKGNCSFRQAFTVVSQKTARQIGFFVRELVPLSQQACYRSPPATLLLDAFTTEQATELRRCVELVESSRSRFEGIDDAKTLKTARGGNKWTLVKQAFESPSSVTAVALKRWWGIWGDPSKMWRSHGGAPLRQLSHQTNQFWQLLGKPPQSLTSLRAQAERRGWESGDEATKLATHDAMSHLPATANRHYIQPASSPARAVASTLRALEATSFFTASIPCYSYRSSSPSFAQEPSVSASVPSSWPVVATTEEVKETKLGWLGVGRREGEANCGRFWSYGYVWGGLCFVVGAGCEIWGL
jgi:hypothetical protein